MSDSEDTISIADSEPKKTIWGKMKDLKTHAAEAAFNEKVYLLLRALLKEEKNFNPDDKSDKNIRDECNNLYTTWENYLDNESDVNKATQLPQLKEAYLKCEPLVEKKLKKYTYEKGVKMAGDAKAKAQLLRTQGMAAARARKDAIMKQAEAFARTASAQYKNMSANLTSIAKNIAEQTKHLSGVAKEEAIKRASKSQARHLVGEERKDMEDNLEKLANLGPAAPAGGARLTRKRKRKRKKRRTRRNRKLN